jgi:hypothetical protein
MTACSWRNGHPCHLAGGDNPNGLNSFQRCLLCTLNEILRELEWRRENR